MALSPRPRVMIVADTAFTSRMIEWFGAGAWSHFANVLHDGTVIDARSDRVDNIPPGVQRRPAAYLNAVAKWLLLELGTAPQYAPWEAVLVSQLNKPYDKIGILNFVTGSVYDRNWREESAWFCSELGTWALEKAGISPRLPDPVYRVTPGAALLLCIGLGATVIASRG